MFVFQPILMDGGNYIKEGMDSAKSTCLIFSPKEEAVGALAKCLKLFEVLSFDISFLLNFKTVQQKSGSCNHIYNYWIPCFSNMTNQFTKCMFLIKSLNIVRILIFYFYRINGVLLKSRIFCFHYQM